MVKRGRTVHESGVISAVEKMFRTDPKGALAVGRTYAGLTSGAFPQEWVDAVFQNHSGAPTIHDAFVFHKIWHWIHTGRIGVVLVHVGSDPVADALVSDNQQALDKMTRAMPQFSATVRSGKGLHDDDGVFQWSEPIAFSRHFMTDAVCSCDDDVHSCAAGYKEDWSVGASGTMLEIGTTAASRTYLHIFAEGGVARWPYRSDDVFIFRAHPLLREEMDLRATGT